MEFKEYKLKDLCDIIDSLHKTPSYKVQGIPMIRVKDLFNGYFIIPKEAMLVSEEVYEEFSKKHKPAFNDILMSRVGTYGLISLIKTEDKFCLGQNTLVMTNFSENILSEYLFYFLLSPYGKELIEKSVSGSTQKTISLKSINDFDILVPKIDYQKSIIRILSSFYNKIETNKRIIANLEDQAQALFKYYFIDFEPFVDGNFVDSELGNIPENWDVKKVDKICDLKIGRTPPRKETECFSSKNGINWVSIKDMGDAHVFINNTSEYLTEEAVEKYRVPMVDENTLIMSFKLTVGRIAITMDKMTTNEAIAHFNNTIISENYLYFYFKNFKFNSLGNTSSIGNAVNSKIIKNIDVLIPTDEILEIFDLKVKAIMEFIKNLTEQNQTLAETRDALLPKLMAGEIDLENLGGPYD